MRVAEVQMTIRSFGSAAVIARVGFDNLEMAKAEYQRVADLMAKEVDNHNDKPPTVEVIGDSGEKHTLTLRDIVSVGLMDYAYANESLKGMRDTFAAVFKKDA